LEIKTGELEINAGAQYVVMNHSTVHAHRAAR